MKRVVAALVLFSAPAWPPAASLVSDDRPNAAPPATPSAQPGPQDSPLERPARLLKNFKAGRDLLLRKGVPFDPDELLDRGWQAKLSPKPAAMPEVQVSRRPGKRLKGVQLADILYLPEKVELTGDTVILAGQVVFEGRDAAIGGHFNVYFFPVEAEGVLGTTLESAMAEQGFKSSGVNFVRAGYNAPTRARRFVPRFLQDGWSLTADTSGRGYGDWLEEQRQQNEVSYRRAALRRQT